MLIRLWFPSDVIGVQPYHGNPLLAEVSIIMPKSKSSGKRSPLWLHPSGQWCRKLKRKFHYFGTDREEAERRYREEWDGILKGKTPRRRGGSLALGDLCNRFLTAKRLRVDTGELSSRQWAEYHATCDHLTSAFGRDTKVDDLLPEDFGRLRAKAAKRLGPPALAKFVQMVRTVFIFAYKSDLIEVPIKYGDQFDKPPRRVMRLERAKKDAKLIGAADVWKLLDNADVQMKAMILLGLNAGYGQADCSVLKRSDLRARPGWLVSPRQKTGIERRCPLWPETIAALEAVHRIRPASLHPADSDCVFITTRGRRWVRFVDRGKEQVGYRNDTAGQQFKALTKLAKVKVPGGLYVMRHTFRTIGDAARDQIAVDVIMGHADPTIAAAYREMIEDDRLRAVTDHVRKWFLDGKPKDGADKSAAKERAPATA